MDITDKMIGRAEAEREYARKCYSEFFNEINERIDRFISYLKEEQPSGDNPSPLEVGRKSFSNK